MKKKILSLTLVVCLLAIAVVGGTLAYFTDDTGVAENTFTVGDVEITLDEAKVNEYGVEVPGANRVLENTYKLNSVSAVISREICSCPFFIAFGHDVQKRKGEL